MPQHVSAEAISRPVRTKDWNIHGSEAGERRPVVMLHSGSSATGESNAQDLWIGSRGVREGRTFPNDLRVTE
ncbi:hypothetical protein SCANM124S_01017 [Streptomyces canus]